MAKNIIVQHVDDLTREVIPTGQGGPVEFSFAGSSYTIDLSDYNQAKFAELLAPYIDHATKTGRQLTRTVSSVKQRKEHTVRIRTWAQNNGVEVSDRGRISKAVEDAYARAHAG